MAQGMGKVSVLGRRELEKPGEQQEVSASWGPGDDQQGRGAVEKPRERQRQ